MHRSNAGFSLVELMCVVAIIGVLSLLGNSYSKIFKFKAIRSEAVTGISHLVQLEEMYRSEHGKYVEMLGPSGSSYGLNANLGVYQCFNNELGFAIKPCTDGPRSNGPGPRYGFYVVDTTGPGGPGSAGASYSIGVIGDNYFPT